ncbi:MAG: hypothetical protein VX589_06455, partial [Myxococcota bacterium]|nr:hypothetical protein [Myxococcota bacterium]
TAKRENRAGTEMTNQAWHARLGYNFQLDRSQLSPFAMYTQLKGDDVTESEWQGELQAMNMYVGTSDLIDMGVNWHFRAHKLRAGLHAIYVTQKEMDGTLLQQPVRAGWSGFLTLQVQR